LLRFASAAAVLLPLALLRAGPLPRGATLVGLLLLGSVGYVAQSLTYFTALTMTSAALLGLLLYMYPVVVAVLASFLFHVPLTRTRIVSLGLALVGAGLTIGPVGEGSWAGIGLGLTSSLIYSFYILAATRISRGVHPLTSAAIITTSAALGFGALALVRGVTVPATPIGWFGIGAIALVSTVVAILTFMAGLARIGPTDSATLSTLEPAVTAVLAVTLLGEVLAPIQVLGGGLILAAALVVARSGLRRVA
jgi:drug/metabolite transporter (DMT)-like permease